MAELFRAKVPPILEKEGLVDNAFIAMIMKWRHTSGFSSELGTNHTIISSPCLLVVWPEKLLLLTYNFRLAFRTRREIVAAITSGLKGFVIYSSMPAARHLCWSPLMV